MCLFILSLLFGIDVVRAQTETPTPEPTPTFHPLFVTSTPSSPQDYTCPGYQPVGWGYVTPAPSWLLQCYQCVTPGFGYEWPTFEWDGFGTPEATTTPFFTPTATQELLVPEVCYAGVCFDEEIIHPYHLDFTYSTISMPYLSVDFLPDGYSYSVGIAESGHISISPKATSPYYGVVRKYFKCAHPVTITIIYSDIPEIPAETVIELSQNDDVLYSFFEYYRPDGLEQEFHLIYDVEVHYNQEIIALDFQTRFEFSGLVGLDNEFDIGITWWNGGYDPIPEPTPFSGYCGVVVAEGGGGGGVDDPFSIPGIWVGVGDCFSIGSVTIPLEWLDFIFSGIEDVITPGFEVCFVPIAFGDLNMFGLTISLDYMAIAMAMVLLIRIITRS